jgi:hypothetical protein
MSVKPVGEERLCNVNSLQLPSSIGLGKIKAKIIQTQPCVLGRIQLSWNIALLSSSVNFL